MINNKSCNKIYVRVKHVQRVKFQEYLNMYFNFCRFLIEKKNWEIKIKVLKKMFSYY